MFDTTVLDLNSFDTDNTFRASGNIQRDFIGEPEERREFILRIYGKYAGARSLTKALLAEKATEKLLEHKKMYK